MKTNTSLAILLATILFLPVLAGDNAPSEESAGPTSEPVGRGAEGRAVTPVNQVLTPMGRQIELSGLRPQAVALSPDGKLAVTAGKTNEIVVIDHGFVVAHGPPEEVLTDDLLARVYGIGAVRRTVDGETLVMPWSLA